MSKNFSDIHLGDLLSPSIKSDPLLNAGTEGVNTELQRAYGDIDLVYIYSVIDSLGSDALDYLAWQFHVDFYRTDLDLATKRTLVKESLGWHSLKGTAPPLRALIVAATTLTPELREFKQFKCDYSLLDQDVIVDPPHNYALDVILDRDDSAAAGVDRDEVQGIVDEMVPERSKSGAVVRFLGMVCDDDIYSRLDVDLLGT